MLFGIGVASKSENPLDYEVNKLLKGSSYMILEINRIIIT